MYCITYLLTQHYVQAEIVDIVFEMFQVFSTYSECCAQNLQSVHYLLSRFTCLKNRLFQSFASLASNWHMENLSALQFCTIIATKYHMFAKYENCTVAIFFSKLANVANFECQMWSVVFEISWKNNWMSFGMEICGGK